MFNVYFFNHGLLWCLKKGKELKKTHLHAKDSLLSPKDPFSSCPVVAVFILFSIQPIEIKFVLKKIRYCCQFTVKNRK